MGQTQHTVGTANVRASCMLLLATGNVGAPGTGANIFRGHDNVQGATDLGLDIVTLPLYYGLVEGAWKHWAPRLGGRLRLVRRSLRQEHRPGRQADQHDEHAGHPVDPLVRRDALRQEGRQAEGQRQGDVRHGSRRQHRDPHAAGAEGHRGARPAGGLRSASDHLGGAGAEAARTAPICCRSRRSYETAGSRTASNRALQWGEQIVKPIFESKDDNEVMYLLAKKLGFADQMFKNIKVENNVPVAEDMLREINRGGWSTGYCGQSPERLKSHMANQKDFDMLTQKATTGPNKGDYYGLPWPCWGTPEFKHPGTPLLYNTNLVGQGRRRHVPRPLRRRARGDAARRQQAQGQPARQRLLLQGFRDQGRLSGVHLWRAEEARLGQGPHRGRAGRDRARSAADKPDAVSWSIDLSGGIQRVVDQARLRRPTATARRAPMRSACPTPSRPTASRSTRRAPNWSPSIRRCRTPCSSGVPNVGFDVQKAAVDKGIAKQFPLILTLGPPGRVRGRRRGDAVQQVARRAAAGHVHRDQSCGRRRARHQGRRLGLGHRRRERLQGAA